MKKGILLVLVLLVIIVSSLSLPEEAPIDSQVLIDAVEKGEADVIVILKDTTLPSRMRIASPTTQDKQLRIEKAQNQVLEDFKQDEFKLEHKLNLINGFSGKLSKEAIDKLRRNPNVKAIYTNRKVRISLDDSVPLINATGFWNVSIDGVAVNGSTQTVCVIDTGIDYTHPALGGCFGAGCKVIGGYDFVNGDDTPLDDNGHGTHVAGIIASTDSTYKGVAPAAKLVAIKALDSIGEGTDADVVAGISWCINESSTYNITVISMSLGTEESYNLSCDEYFPDTYSLIINASVDANISVIVASGNDGLGYNITAPACIAKAVSVGSTNKNDVIAAYSNSAPFLDLLAPGTLITSTILSSSFGSANGTSMACPHVSGAFVLLREFKQRENGTLLTPSQINNVLKATGKNITDVLNGLNFSRINLSGALTALDSTPTIISAEPANQSTVTTQNYTISATFSEPLSNKTLTLNNVQYTMNGSGYTYYYNATLIEGDYNFTIYFEDSTGNPDQTGIYFFSADFYPQWSGNSTYPASGQTYTSGQVYQFNVTWNDSTLENVWIEHNFNGSFANYTPENASNTYFFYNTTLAAGNYQWRMIARDAGSKYTSTPMFSYAVARADPGLSLLLNGSASNTSINQTWAVNITASYTGEGDFSLYLNGDSLYTGTTYSAAHGFDYSGYQNITLSYAQSQNYSASLVTLWILVNDTCNPPSSGDWTLNGEKIICYAKDVSVSGNLYVLSNSNLTLYLSNLTVGSQVMNIQDNARLYMINSSIYGTGFRVYLREESEGLLTDSTTAANLSVEGLANLTSISGQHSLLWLGDQSTTSFYNSIISDLRIAYSHEQGSIYNLSSAKDEFIFSSNDNSFFSNLTNLTQSQIKIYVQNLSDISIHNSTLDEVVIRYNQNNLTLNNSVISTLSTYHDSSLYLYNSSLSQVTLTGNSSVNSLKTSVLGSATLTNSPVITGNLSISSISFSSNTQATRLYPAYVRYQSGSLADGIEINVSGRFNGTTSSGYININLSFNSSTYQNTYDIYIADYARANVSLTETTPLNITYDNTNPVITYNSPSNNTFVSTPISLNLSTDDESTCTYKINNNSTVSFGSSYSTVFTGSVALPDGHYNITFNCTNRYYLSSSGMANISIDSNAPSLEIIYPSNSQVINVLNIDFNYTVNDSSLSQAWYFLNENNTKIMLSAGNDLNQSITFDFPGRHIIRLYANDSAQNIRVTNITIFVNQSLNLTKWKQKITDVNSNISSITVRNITGQEINDSVQINQNMSISINLSHILVNIINVSGLRSSWQTLFDIAYNSSGFESDVMTQLSTVPVHYVNINNFTWFTYDSEYYGTVQLPSNATSYTRLYYCSDWLDSCQIITGTCTTYSDSDTTPCYNTNETTTIYIPHFSSIIGDIDSIGPNISIDAPENNSILSGSYANTIFVSTNENSYCSYSTNISDFDITGYSNAYRAFSQSNAKSFSVTVSDVWKNSRYSVTVNCNDTEGNGNTVTNYFNVSDSTDPVISGFSASTTTSSASFSWSTNEPANCTLNLGGSVQNCGYSTSQSKSYTGLSDGRSYSYTLNVYDHNGNLATASGSVTTTSETDDNSNTGSSTSTDTSAPKKSSGMGPTKVSALWTKLESGNHTMFVTSSSIALTKIVFEVKNQINQSATMSVENTTYPDNIPKLDPELYQLLSITKSNIKDSDLGRVKIYFRVTNSWITLNAIDRNTIRLYRFDKTWNEMHTNYEDSDSNYVYYNAEVPGLSYFAIKGNKFPVTSTPKKESSTPKIQGEVTGEIIRNISQAHSTEHETTQPKQKNDYLMPAIIILIIVILITFLVYQNRYSVVIDKDFTELRSYIQRCESEGFSLEKIKEKLVQVGWDEKMVELVMHEVHIPHNELNKLVKYIQYAYDNGLNENEIKTRLRGVGWQDEVIQYALTQFK